MSRPVIPDELPDEMRTNSRPLIERFEVDEILYRRVPPESRYFDFDRVRIEIDSVDLPDMSVNRGTLSQPSWLLVDFPNAGVAAFHVRDIPPPLQHLGTIWYTSFAKHRPLKKNYAHSQIEAYEAERPLEDSSQGIHVDGKKAMIHHPAHLRWRYQLLQKLRIVINPVLVDPA